MPYYVVNAGRGRSTHIMESRDPSTPNPMSPGSIVAELLWFGGKAKPTLCGLAAARYVNVFTPVEASCRECRRRWELAQQGTHQKATSEAARVTALTPEQRRAGAKREAIKAVASVLFVLVLVVVILGDLAYMGKL